MSACDTTTRGIRIQVRSEFIPDRSSPRDGSYLFQYHVRISNVGAETAQLISREWIITNADGEVERVKGPGVVGEQPVLPPGRLVRIHELLPAQDRGRLDAGQLSDGDGRRRALRRRDRAVHARRTERPELGRIVAHVLVTSRPAYYVAAYLKLASASASLS